MDSAERRTLLHQLAGAFAGAPSCLAFFFEHELLDHIERQQAEPTSALYVVADAAAGLGLELSDVYYDDKDPSKVVMERLVHLPEIGSRWVFPLWNNPDYAGPWEVVRIGEGFEFTEAVILRRVYGDEQETECGVAFWPGSWEPAD